MRFLNIIHYNTKTVGRGRKNKADPGGSALFLKIGSVSQNSAELHQHLSGLHTGGGASGIQVTTGLAGQDTLAAGPLHGGDGPLADGEGIVVAQDVGVLANAHVSALIACIGAQHNGHLLAGDGIVRAEDVSGVTGDDTLGSGPADSLSVPGTGGHIVEGHGVVHNGLAVHGPQDLDDHAAGQVHGGSKLVGGDTVHHAVLDDKVDSLVIPGVGIQIDELVGGALLGNQTEDGSDGDLGSGHLEGILAVLLGDLDLVALLVNDGDGLQLITLVGLGSDGDFLALGSVLVGQGDGAVLSLFNSDRLGDSAAATAAAAVDGQGQLQVVGGKFAIIDVGIAADDDLYGIGASGLGGLGRRG